MRLRSLLAAIAAIALFAGTTHAAPVHLWSHRYVHDDDQWIEKVAVDPSGNIIVCGVFYTSLELGQVYPSLGFSDGFVAKFDPNGNLLWVHQLGDVRPDRTWDLAVDALGNVIVVGSLSASMNDSDVMVVKYAPNGTQSWLKRFGLDPTSFRK